MKLKNSTREYLENVTEMICTELELRKKAMEKFTRCGLKELQFDNITVNRFEGNKFNERITVERVTMVFDNPSSAIGKDFIPFYLTNCDTPEKLVKQVTDLILTMSEMDQD